MAIEQEDVNLVKDELWPDEVIALTVRQRRVGPGGSVVTPTSLIATNKRIIIVNLVTLGLRKDVETLLYNRIAGVRFEHGIISSSVYLRMGGNDNDIGGFLKNSGKGEGEIDGLNNKDAEELSDYIDRIITREAPARGPIQSMGKGGPGSFCPNCGASLRAGERFCSSCGARIN